MHTNVRDESTYPFPNFNGWHDVDVPRMLETYLAIAIYVSVTSVDHPGWPAAVFSGMFAH